jgi:hypothetical protein
VTAALAWYASAAVLINNTFKTVILPIGVYAPKEKKSSTITRYP